MSAPAEASSTRICTTTISQSSRPRFGEFPLIFTSELPRPCLVHLRIHIDGFQLPCGQFPNDGKTTFLALTHTAYRSGQLRLPLPANPARCLSRRSQARHLRERCRLLQWPMPVPAWLLRRILLDHRLSEWRISHGSAIVLPLPIRVPRDILPIS